MLHFCCTKISRRRKNYFKEVHSNLSFIQRSCGKHVVDQFDSWQTVTSEKCVPLKFWHVSEIWCPTEIRTPGRIGLGLCYSVKLSKLSPLECDRNFTGDGRRRTWELASNDAHGQWYWESDTAFSVVWRIFDRYSHWSKYYCLIIKKFSECAPSGLNE